MASHRIPVAFQTIVNLVTDKTLISGYNESWFINTIHLFWIKLYYIWTTERATFTLLRKVDGVVFGLPSGRKSFFRSAVLQFLAVSNAFFSCSVNCHGHFISYDPLSMSKNCSALFCWMERLRILSRLIFLGHCSSHLVDSIRSASFLNSMRAEVFYVISRLATAFWVLEDHRGQPQIPCVIVMRCIQSKRYVRPVCSVFRLSFDFFRASSWTPCWTASWYPWSLWTHGRPRPPLKNCCGRALPVARLPTATNHSLKPWRRANGFCRLVLSTRSVCFSVPALMETHELCVLPCDGQASHPGCISTSDSWDRLRILRKPDRNEVLAELMNQSISVYRLLKYCNVAKQVPVAPPPAQGPLALQVSM